MPQGVQDRLKTFNQVTPENRVALVHTQIGRRVEKNRSRLTAAVLSREDLMQALTIRAAYIPQKG